MLPVLFGSVKNDSIWRDISHLCCSSSESEDHDFHLFCWRPRSSVASCAKLSRPSSSSSLVKEDMSFIHMAVQNLDNSCPPFPHRECSSAGREPSLPTVCAAATCLTSSCHHLQSPVMLRAPTTSPRSFR